MKRPPFFPDWAAGASAGNLPTIQPPTDEERTQGIVRGRGLRRQVVNWMFQSLGQWVRYLEQGAFNPSDVFGHGLIGRFHTHLASGLVQPEGHIQTGAYVTRTGAYASRLEVPEYTYSANSDVWWMLNRDLTFTPVSAPMGTASAPEPSSVQDACLYHVRTNDSRIVSATPVGDNGSGGYRRRAIRFNRPLEALLWLRQLKMPEGDDRALATTLIQAERADLRVVYCLNVKGLYDGDIGPSIGILVNAELFVDENTGREMVRCGSSGSSFFYVFGGDGLNILHHHPRLRSESTNNVLHNSTEGPWGQHWHVRNQLGGVRAEDLT